MRAHTGDNNNNRDEHPSPPAEMAPITPWLGPSMALGSH